MAEYYVVRQGDCIDSIAYDHGFFWQTLWNHPENAELKRKRKDPNILKEGDVVYIPDLRAKQESASTEQKHRFVRKAVPAKLRLRFMKPKEPTEPQEDSGGTPAGDESSYEDPEVEENPVEFEPRADAPYLLVIGAVTKTGNLDGDGRVEVTIPPSAREGRLILHPGTGDELVVPLDLGAMDPADEISGVRRRLRNLGFACTAEGDDMTGDLEAALREFQKQNGLEATGAADQATADKLKELHGS